MTAIYKRELKSYFDSMTGYLFLAFISLFMGIYFLAYNLAGGYPYFTYTLSGVLTVLLVAVPVLTMRSMAEERRSKTDQLLLTAPVSVTEIVMGKFLSMVTVFAVPVLVSCLCPLIIEMNGTAYLAEDYAGILAFFLLGCVYIAIGLFISSLTESQVIAAVGTFGVLFLLILWPSLMKFLPVSAMGSLIGFLLLLSGAVFVIYRVTEHRLLAAVLEGIGAAGLILLYIFKKSVLEHSLAAVLGKVALADVFDNFTRNHIFDAGGLFYYLSIIFLLIFLTVQSVEKRRWS